MVLVVEPRHRVIGLRLKPCARDPPARQGLENRKTAAANEAVNQGGDEDGLAGARQAGDAEPDRRVEKMRRHNRTVPVADRRASSTISEKLRAMLEG